MSVPDMHLQHVHTDVRVQRDTPHMRIQLHFIPNAHKPRLLDLLPLLTWQSPLSLVIIVVSRGHVDLGLGCGIHELGALDRRASPHLFEFVHRK